MSEILRVEHLKKIFVKKRMWGAQSDITRAVDDISFSVDSGQVLVLAGESGSGKSTIVKLILKSIEADKGKIFFKGQEINTKKDSLKKIRMNCQMIQQDPYDSINPRMRVRDIVSEPLEIHKMGDRQQRDQRVIDVLHEVRLEPARDIANRYPHMLSGGQRQRVVLARALAPRPKIILADEPVSMLDVSVRAEMLELMQELQKRHGISFVYITHDLATARYFGQRIAVLYKGKIVESGPVEQVLDSPMHPYTQALIDAVSEPNYKNLNREKKIRIIDGPVNTDSQQGCRFRARCPYAIKECVKEPELEKRDGTHSCACHVKLD